ncbi:ATPase [Methanobacterium alcaliphilum]|uniref:ATPase n=1 Tax=Methanobacterium alcaliphilum TaxID=392018 RepID=UPI00200A85E9|nr:ATPase [Methanobacterium alcaliphilum]MCK9151731.1 ATPase [Methanobacterium alcaliphilum]
MSAENSNYNKKEILRFLKQIGVDSRFISVIPPDIYINNLRFSKFSRKKEELFKKKYPAIKVVRSTILQKICLRSSRVLGEALKPRTKVLINSNNDPCNKAVSVILEPYSRKYGIEIIEREFNLKDIEEYDFDALVVPLTLDHEVASILYKIFHGEKIDLLSFQDKKGSKQLIYPLINVPLEWIYSWLKLKDTHEVEMENEISHEFLIFLEDVVPQVRENIFKASTFLNKKNIIS